MISWFDESIETPDHFFNILLSSFLDFIMISCFDESIENPDHI